MELRHLRYFVAVAEAGSLTVAAEKRLHTAQPSLSRQIRDLEYEVGVSLMNRSVHGIELPPPGAPFSIMRGWHLLRRRQLRRQRGARRNRPNRLSPWVSKSGWKGFGCRLPPASCGTSCSISKSGFRATTRQSWPTTSSVASLISLSSAGTKSLISNTNWWQRNRFSYFCRVIIGSLGTRPSILTISSVRHLSAYQKSRACCVRSSVII